MSRCFIVVDLPGSIISEVKRVQNELKTCNLFSGKFTDINNVHLTLKFLGEINEQKVEKVKTGLANVKFKEFVGELSEIGVFSEKFVRIIWLKLDGKDVFELQKQIDSVLAGLFDKEDRFMSHITIARVKHVKEKDKLLNHLREMKIEKIKGAINSFSLYKSTLTKEGPIYEVIKRYNCE